MIGTTAEEQDNSQDDQPDNGKDLDRCEPELGFTEKGYRNDVQE
jgi:hypothetical protein